MTTKAEVNSKTHGTADLAEELRSVLEKQWNVAVVIEDLQRLSAGASREMWRFKAVARGEVTALILRRPPSSKVDPKYQTPLNSARQWECELLQILRLHGVKVPEVVLDLDTEAKTTSKEPGAGYIMQCLPGEGIPGRLLNDDTYADISHRVPTYLAESISAAHRVPVAELPPLATLGAEAQIAILRQLIDRFGMKHPGLEWAMRWVNDNLTEEVTPGLVHGDFRLGNFLVNGEEVSGIIDWEMAHLGDPMEDLAWLCMRSWRFSRPELPVAGLGDRVDLFKAYENATATFVDPERVRFWEALGNIKWAAICLMQYSRFLHSDNIGANIESAAIGRRFDEALYDFFDVVDHWKY